MNRKRNEIAKTEKKEVVHLRKNVMIPAVINQVVRFRLNIIVIVSVIVSVIVKRM